MSTRLDFSQFRWINKPTHYQITDGIIIITTDPQTDFWQRTYYNFQHDNGHAFILPIKESEFTFSIKTSWAPKKLFDQCGIIIFIDEDNWCKASVEYENERLAQLGSVVTNLGYSDWATTAVDSNQHQMVYRLHRRDQDFKIENSFDGQVFRQMRLFHMHRSMDIVDIGVYACSPLNSSFQAVFSDFSLGQCLWETYVNPDE